MIGLGQWGHRYLETISSMGNPKLGAVATRNESLIPSLPQGCQVFSNWRDLLDLPNIKGLIVASPSATHAEIAMAAIRAGLPSLVEKPMTENPDIAKKIATSASEADLKVLVNYIHLFNPSWGWLQTNIGLIGQVLSIESQGGNLGPFRTDCNPIWDWLPHDLAMVLSLTGTYPKRLDARRSESKNFIEGYGEIVEVVLEFPAAIRALIRTGNSVSPKTRRLIVEGRNGSALIDDVSRISRIDLKTGEQISMPHTHSITPLRSVINAFSNAILGKDEDPPETLNLTISITEIISSITQAIGDTGECDWTKVSI